MIAPDDFMVNGKAWIEAIAAVANTLIAQVGILGLAAIALVQNLRTKAHNKEVTDRIDARLDRQGDRINEVALAVPAAPAITPAVNLTQAPGDPPPRVTNEPEPRT